eukprot:Awhi_evm2s11361
MKKDSFGDFLYYTTARSLHLDCLNKNDVSQLLEVLKINTNLSSLILSNTELDAEDTLKLAGIIKVNSTLTQLTVSFQLDRISKVGIISDIIGFIEDENEIYVGNEIHDGHQVHAVDNVSDNDIVKLTANEKEGAKKIESSDQSLQFFFQSLTVFNLITNLTLPNSLSND